MKGGKLYCGENYTPEGVRAGINYKQGISAFAKVYVQAGGSVHLECFRGHHQLQYHTPEVFYENADNVQWMKNDAAERDKTISDTWFTKWTTEHDEPIRIGNLPKRCALGCWNGGTPNAACTACERCDGGFAAADNCKECAGPECITTTQTSSTTTTTTTISTTTTSLTSTTATTISTTTTSRT